MNFEMKIFQVPYIYRYMMSAYIGFGNSFANFLNCKVNNTKL